jgi:hypothetical protein
MTANPTAIPARKRLLPTGNLADLQAAYRVKRKTRAYGIGERNPTTLPGYDKSNETFDQNRERSAYWTQLRRKVQAGARLNRKS